MSIRKNILIPTVVMIIVCSVTAFVLSMWLYYRGLYTNAENKVNIATTLAANILESYEQSARMAAFITAGHGELRQALQQEDFIHHEILSAAHNITSLTGMDFCTILDAQGTVLARTHEPELHSDSLAYQHSIKSALAGERATVIEYGNVILLSLRSTAPVYDHDNNIIGVVSLGFRLDTPLFAETLREITQCDVFIYKQDECISSTLRDENEQLIPVSTEPMLDIVKNVHNGGSHLGEVDIAGKKMLTTFLPIHGPQGDIIATIAISNSWRDDINRAEEYQLYGIISTLVFVLVAIIVAIAASYFIDRRFNNLMKIINEANRNRDAIMEALDSMIVITTIESDEIVYVNNKMKELLSFDDSVVGDKCWKHFNKDQNGRCAHCPKHQKEFYEGKPYTWEFHNPHVHRDHRITSRILDWPDGTKVMIEQVDDITDMKRAAAELRRADEVKDTLAILGGILDGIEAQIYVSEPETGELLFVNKRLLGFFGIGIDDAVGKPCYEVFRGFDAKCDFCPCKALDENPNQTITWMEDLEDIDKTILHNDCYIDWPGGKKVHLQSAVDVTAQRKAELEIVEKNEQLEYALYTAERANKAKSAFLANMSHEIRTPMNAILSIIEIQMRDHTLSPNVEKELEMVYESGNLLLNIINDILDLSKIEAGKMELVPVKYDMPSLIIDAVQLIRLRYDDKPISFILDVDPDTPVEMYGDELRLKQILSNILSNAFKYTERGKVKLTINTATQASPLPPDKVTICFRVSDTGQGMTEQELELLFDEYRRFNIEANRTTVGTGLGMSITKHLVELMGGEITVTSKVDVGSVFTVNVPQGVLSGRVCGQKLSDKLRAFDFQSASISKKEQIIREPMPYGSVLIVDDMASNIYVTKGMLMPYSLQIDSAKSGFEAIEKIKDGNEYDIILMDHMMPEMDGIETLNKLRNDYGYTKTVIAYTANALVGHKQMFLDSGFDGYLSKPIDSRELDQILNEFIKDKHKKQT